MFVFNLNILLRMNIISSKVFKYYLRATHEWRCVIRGGGGGSAKCDETWKGGRGGGGWLRRKTTSCFYVRERSKRAKKNEYNGQKHDIVRGSWFESVYLWQSVTRGGGDPKPNYQYDVIYEQPFKQLLRMFPVINNTL